MASRGRRLLLLGAAAAFLLLAVGGAEPPTGKVARKKGYDGRETLICQLYGFYPKEIEVTWVKDGEDRKQDTLTGDVVPNSDGTYHTWLSIEVDPKERDRYRCRVEHESLPEPLNLAWEESASAFNLEVIIVGAVSAVVMLMFIIIFLKIRRRLENDYKAKPEKYRLECGYEAPPEKYRPECGYEAPPEKLGWLEDGCEAAPVEKQSWTESDYKAGAGHSQNSDNSIT